MTLSEALGWMKTLKTRHAELIALRDQNSKRTKTHWGGEKDPEVIEPTYDVKKLDKRVTLIAREIRVLDEAIKRTNAATEMASYIKDESVLGELED